MNIHEIKLEVEKLSLSPGDLLIIKIPTGLTAEARSRIRDILSTDLYDFLKERNSRAIIITKDTDISKYDENL